MASMIDEAKGEGMCDVSDEFTLSYVMTSNDEVNQLSGGFFIIISCTCPCVRDHALNAVSFA